MDGVKSVPIRFPRIAPPHPRDVAGRFPFCYIAGVGDTTRIPYIVKDGVLKLSGELKYQDRELRLACMMLIQGPQPVVCMDLSKVPSLCSPEIQFIAKMAESARQRGKNLKVRLSKTLRQMFTDLELGGLIQIEEVEGKPASASSPVPRPTPPANPPPAAPGTHRP